MREALEEHGVRCELLVVSDGERAIRFMQRIDSVETPCPSLVILDLNLPRMAGREVLRRLRGSEACSRTPVIVLTSSDSQKDRDDAARLGASRYIRKPSRLAEFLDLGAVFKSYLE